MRADRMLIAVAALVLWLSTAASAQQLAALKNTTPLQRARLLTRLMQKKLGLSGKTLEQVSAINLEYANKAQPILQSADRPLEELREMRELNEQKDAALQKVLSADQFQQYQAAKAELRQRFEQRIMQGVNKPTESPH